MNQLQQGTNSEAPPSLPVSSILRGGPVGKPNVKGAAGKETKPAGKFDASTAKDKKTTSKTDQPDSPASETKPTPSSAPAEATTSDQAAATSIRPATMGTTTVALNAEHVKTAAGNSQLNSDKSKSDNLVERVAAIERSLKDVGLNATQSPP